ncbi:hypothetical protein HGP16_18500 [Rhizobium sp. P40RR-XXII]|uniref:hypothetical protein n=1 Tax=Rhizobium sp. P40RR-XXII TaxID=2726739 RepID=UPI001456ACB0|nr:hypothetical protein [Rhizobium sp. P40RR-XXII]NLS18553.1 hypothetical protein [Rhizobium sp. P40RR-XXII]
MSLVTPSHGLCDTITIFIGASYTFRHASAAIVVALVAIPVTDGSDRNPFVANSYTWVMAMMTID